MRFTEIDFESWERREYFEMFRNSTVYMTVELDVTEFFAKVKQAGLRVYPCLIYCVAEVINENEAFRYAFDEEGQLGLWDRLNPFYTVKRKDNPRLFSMKYTEFSGDFGEFYHRFEEERTVAENCTRVLCDESLPSNIFGISAVPGIHFSAFSFGGTKEDLIPFVLLGKAEEKDGRRIMPVAGEFSHAVNDGFHIELFFSRLEEKMRNLLSENDFSLK